MRGMYGKKDSIYHCMILSNTDLNVLPLVSGRYRAGQSSYEESRGRLQKLLHEPCTSIRHLLRTRPPWGYGHQVSLVYFWNFRSRAFALVMLDCMTVMISSRFILFQREGLSFSNWDKWVVQGTQDYKLKSFLKHFKVRTQLLWKCMVLLWSRNHAGDLVVNSASLVSVLMRYFLEQNLHTASFHPGV